MIPKSGKNEYIYIILITMALVVIIQMVMSSDLIYEPFDEGQYQSSNYNNSGNIIHTESKKRLLELNIIDAETAGVDIYLNGENVCSRVSVKTSISVNDRDIITIVNHNETDVAIGLVQTDIMLCPSDGEGQLSSQVMITACQQCNYIVFFTNL